MKHFVHLILPAGSTTLYWKCWKYYYSVIIRAGRIVQVPCKEDVGFVKVKRVMLFQPGEINVPEGLQYAETVVMLKSSVNNYFKIPVVNIPVKMLFYTRTLNLVT